MGVQTSMVCQLTGPVGDRSTVKTGNVSMADLGHMFDNDGVLYMVFGDTYGPGSTAPSNANHRAVDWRSNTMVAISDWRQLLVKGLSGAPMIKDRVASSADQNDHAKELLPSAYARATNQWPPEWERVSERDEATKIPTHGIAVDGRMFLHYFSAPKDWMAPGRGFNYASIAYSDDRGYTWKPVPWRWDRGSNFSQVAFARDATHIYVFGIPDNRDGSVKLARVEANRLGLLYKPAYEYWCWKDNRWQWIRAAEGNASTVAEGPAGELSVIYNGYLGRWIMMYGSKVHDGILMRDAPHPVGPWSAPRLVHSERGAYGPFMHPWLVEENGKSVYFTLSRWGAYQVFLMKATF